MKLGLLIRETLRGRTLGRTIQNEAFSKIKLGGTGVDLGAGTNSGSYYEFMQLEPGTEIQHSDLEPRCEGVLKIDLEEELPIESETQDFVILNNVLDAIYNHKLCVSECYRILKNGGTVVGAIPFYHPIHPGPDAFRYTKPTLVRLFSETGFKEVEVEPLGYGPFTASVNIVAVMLRFRLLMLVPYITALAMDNILQSLIRLFSKGKGERGQMWSYDKYPVFYLFVCKK